MTTQVSLYGFCWEVDDFGKIISIGRIQKIKNSEIVICGKISCGQKIKTDSSEQEVVRIFLPREIPGIPDKVDAVIWLKNHRGVISPFSYNKLESLL